MRFKKTGIVLLVIGALGVALFGVYYYKNYNQEESLSRSDVISLIASHYSEEVITNDEIKLYNDELEVVGKVNKGVSLLLEDIEIDDTKEYFPLLELEGYYVYYSDVSKVEEISEDITKDRYKNYIPFNQNVKTGDTTIFYDDEDNYLYEINESFDLAVIIKDDNRIGVEYGNSLVYVHIDDGAELYDHHNSDMNNASGVAVLNYHFFYDENDSEDSATCQEQICHSKSQFKSQLDLFKEMNMFTVTMNELEEYMDGKLQLPKSVLITIDDGGRTSIAVDMLTEYKMNATIFLITSWYDPSTYYKTEYIELHSHSHNMHNGGVCSGGQGAEIKCLSRDEILADLSATREALGGSTAFCYPFYEYNDYSESLLKEAGFTMAFIGERTVSYGYQLATVGGDKMKIPRFVIMTHTTLDDIRDYFNEITN